MLPLSRSDGNTFIPVNSCLLASAKESNLIRHICNIVKRTIAGKRIALAQSKVAEAMLTLLDTAVFSGLSADYVLFNCWFANLAQITAIKSRNMDVIAMKRYVICQPVVRNGIQTHTLSNTVMQSGVVAVIQYAVKFLLQTFQKKRVLIGNALIL